MFPIGDQNEPGRGVAYVTLALIGLNVAIFLLLQRAGGESTFTYGWSAVPLEITRGVDLVQAQRVVIGGQPYLVPQAPGPDPIQLTLLSSMFMHAGWLHLAGNIWIVFQLISGFGATVVSDESGGGVAYLAHVGGFAAGVLVGFVLRAFPSGGTRGDGPMVSAVAGPARPDAGLFGPGSMAWRVDGEAMVLAGGTCALLMQLAHPAVAAGVAQHSDFRADPFARLRRTLAASYAVVFGSSARADAALRRINAIHGTVRGRIPESGVAYDATDPDLLLWVHATLVDTAIRVYDRYVSPLSPAEQQEYHAEARQVAVRLGVPESGVPRTLVELRAEMVRLMADGSVAVSDTARSLAPSILHPTAFPPRLAWEAAHLISMSVMPDSIRRGYGIRWSVHRDSGMRRLASLSRRSLPLVPGTLRRVPAARAAERRAARRAGR